MLLYNFSECRSAVLGVICRHLRLHLAHREELDLITEILGKILTTLFHDKRLEITNNKVNIFMLESIITLIRLFLLCIIYI